MSGIARVELSVVDIACMQDQLHAEMNQRLDVVEDHLRSQVMKVGADLVDDGALVLHASCMTSLAIHNALAKPLTVCDFPHQTYGQLTHQVQ